jgi:CRISPR system Cascade subunit CasA
MTRVTGYNLIQEKWIKVMDSEGRIEKVSLLDALNNSHEYTALSGENEQQDLAMLRLMVSVMHGAFWEWKLPGQSVYRNEIEVWRSGKIPEGMVEGYLRGRKDRFYLIHPEAPFYQYAELEDLKKCTENGLGKLIGDVSESGNKERILRKRSGKYEVELDEAARWLVFLQGYADTADKPGIGTGWLGQIGAVYVAGKNLFETLMFNCCPVDINGVEYGKPYPIWDQPIKWESKSEIAPTNPAELMTMQSRQLLLTLDNKGKVTGYRVRAGQYINYEEAQMEQMICWKKGKSKVGNRDIYKPDKSVLLRSIWREAGEMFVDDEDGNTKTADVIRWAKTLTECSGKEVGIGFGKINIQVVGAEYGNMNMMITDYIANSLSVDRSILVGKDAWKGVESTWLKRIAQEVKASDELVKALGELIIEMLSTGVDTGSIEAKRKLYGPRDKVLKVAYNELDRLFKLWLSELALEAEVDEKMEEWWEKAKKLVRGIALSELRGFGGTLFTDRKDIGRVYDRFLYVTSNRERLMNRWKKGGEKENGNVRDTKKDGEQS